MRRVLLLFVVLVVGRPSDVSAQERNMVAEVVRGMTCKQASTGHLECNYRVGEDLEFTIVGVGEEGVNVYVDRSKGMKGDFYISIAVGDSTCVHVKRSDNPDSLADWVAKVSPRTGRVYAVLESCDD